MTTALSWVVFPLVLGLVSLGCGLLLQRLSRTSLPGPLLLPSGFAVVVVAGQLATLWDSTASLATPAVAALGAFGLAASVSRRPPGFDAWAAGSAAAVFAAYAAPIVVSGDATFAGYVKLDDTSTFLALTDRALEHGRDLAGLAPSSYEAALAVNLPFYPLGSLIPWGMGSSLVGQDPAWLFQPYLAFVAALLALVLYELAGRVVDARPLRALAAVVAAQPALLYGYALWGGLKELVAAPLVALVAALAGLALERQTGRLPLLPLAASAAAVLAVLSVGGAIWVVPALGLAAVAALRRKRLWALLAASATLAALVLPSLAVARSVFTPGNVSTLRSESDLGNLLAPLSPLQILGAWPTGDFRLHPDGMGPTYVLLALIAVAAGAGIVLAVRRRAWALPLYASTALAAALAFDRLGSPWVAAKAFAIGSPAFVFAAVLGSAAFFARGRRVEATVAVCAVATGVLWSNALAYREVNLAPREQLAELEAVGERFAGQGPTLMTEYQPYGVRHFLRRADAEGASELRRRLVPLRDGSTLEKGATADLDALQLDGLLTYRTLVLRRSPVASRPPSPYQLVWERRYYEVWQRPEPVTPVVVGRLPLGNALDPAAAAPCEGLRVLAAGAGRLAVAAADRPTVVPLAAGTVPAGWQADGAEPNVVYPARDGTLETSATVAESGRYELWIGGSFRGALTVAVDGEEVGSHRHQLNYAGQFTSLAGVELEPGRHRVALAYRTGGLRPGGGGESWPLGPLVLSPAGRDRTVAHVPAGEAETLCGRSLDWVEALS